MQDTEIIAIANANAGLERIKAMNQAFMKHAEAHASPDDLPSSLQVSADGMAIDCFGHLATAKARPVRAPKDVFCMEYVFTVPNGDCSVEVARFYLSHKGLILDSPGAQSRICDYNNPHIARHLCGRALLGFLASPILEPAPAQR